MISRQGFSLVQSPRSWQIGEAALAKAEEFGRPRWNHIVWILLLVISLTLFYTYTTLQERHYVRRGVPMRFWWSWFKLTRDFRPGSGLLCVCLNWIIAFSASSFAVYRNRVCLWRVCFCICKDRLFFGSGRKDSPWHRSMLQILLSDMTEASTIFLKTYLFPWILTGNLAL